MTAKLRKKVCTFAFDFQHHNKKDVRLDFQKSIANSQATLPIVGGLTFILWFVLPPLHSSISYSASDYGLWHYVPSFLQEGYWTLVISAILAAWAVYLLAELNNANVLLRVNSRMLSSMLSLLLCLMVLCHGFQPGMVVMLLSLMSFFPLFSSYQSSMPQPPFVASLLVSIASLVFPKWLWMMLVYWFILGLFRALSLRSFVSSLLALILPYWLYGGVAFLTSTFPDFMIHLQMMADFQRGDYGQLEFRDVVTFLFVVLLFVVGAVDFSVHQFMDKTRTRIIYNSLISYGVFIIIGVCVQPQYLWVLLPLLMLPTSIVFGHFFTLTYTKFSHICCIVLMVLAVAVLVVQYLPDNLLFQLLTSNF